MRLHRQSYAFWVSKRSQARYSTGRCEAQCLTAEGGEILEQCLSLTAADGLVFIQVQIKPGCHRIHFASCDDFQLQNVVSASALAFPLKEVLKNLAGLCQASVSQLVQVAGLIALIPPEHTPQKVLHLQV